MTVQRGFSYRCHPERSEGSRSSPSRPGHSGRAHGRLGAGEQRVPGLEQWNPARPRTPARPYDSPGRGPLRNVTQVRAPNRIAAMLGRRIPFRVRSEETRCTGSPRDAGVSGAGEERDSQRSGSPCFSLAAARPLPSIIPFDSELARDHDLPGSTGEAPRAEKQCPSTTIYTERGQKEEAARGRFAVLFSHHLLTPAQPAT